MQQYFKIVGRRVRFFSGVVTLSFLWILAIRGPHHLQAEFVWAALSALFTLILMDVQGYFQFYRPLPRLSNLFLFLAAVASSGAFSKYLVNLFAGIEVIRQRQALIGALLIAPGLWVYLWAAGRLMKKVGRHWWIGVALTPSETNEVQSALDGHGLSEFFRVVDVETNAEALDELDYLIISRTQVRGLKHHQKLLDAHLRGVAIFDFSEFIGELTGRLPIEGSNAWSFLMMATPQTALHTVYHRIRTTFEPFIAAAMILVLLPLGLFVTICSMFFNGPGPIFYRQRRVGYRGVNFDLIKFRSMRMDAEKGGAPQWSSGEDDPRVTPWGKFLRKSHLDEMPQLWNVLIGDLSFVGPRPERPEFYEQLEKQIPLFGVRTWVKPGITGWAQVLGGYAASVDESRRKLEFDLYYIQHMSPAMDITISLKTLNLFVRLSDRTER